MRIITFICSVIPICFFFVNEVQAASASRVILSFPTGSIDWSKGVAIANGAALMTPATGKKQEIYSSAIKAATNAARQNLFLTLLEIQIDSNLKLSHLIAIDKEISGKLKTIIKETAAIRKKYSSQGIVDVAIQLSLHGNFAELVLPSEIQKIDMVKPIGNNKVSETALQPKCYTGLIVDARGTAFVPAMAPRLLDENGVEIFGAMFVSREYAIQRGMVSYDVDLGKALKNPRVSDNPMIIKGLTVKGTANCNIIISVSDANRLRSNFNHLAFLKRCRVTVVLSPPMANTIE